MVKILFFLFSILEGGQDNERHVQEDLLKKRIKQRCLITLDIKINLQLNWYHQHRLVEIEYRIQKQQFYIYISSRPLVFCKPEHKLKTQTPSSPQKQSPIKPKQVETQSNELCKLINNYSEPILDYYIELNAYNQQKQNLTPKNCLLITQSVQILEQRWLKFLPQINAKINYSLLLLIPIYLKHNKNIYLKIYIQLV
ncbi:unnamed protein product [Paramecium primaurelia]|uniref:Transmembrane protein n=1 Tax=Paramecium primaurelia TaxID=5886 RepID=A0A8S1QC18_PARPR|nr:unnamed protein product [Paramecium primaurelia]